MSECSALNPSCWLAWIRDELKAFGVWVWDGVLGGVASVLQAIPVPDFLQILAFRLCPLALVILLLLLSFL